MSNEDLVVGHQQPNVVHGGPSYKKRKILKILLTLLLVIGLAVSAYFYQTSSQRLNKLENANQNLKDTITQKDELIAKLRKGLVDGQGGSCDAGASYSAEVGKFTVKLDSPNVIIRDLDAGFEGGPATILGVATCIEGQLNVYDRPPQDVVTITANPNQSSSDLKTAYESGAGAPESTDSTTVAGVPADKNAYTGLFGSTVLFFDNDGIGYQIEVVDISEGTDAILTDIVEDWAFISS